MLVNGRELTLAANRRLIAGVLVALLTTSGPHRSAHAQSAQTPAQPGRLPKKYREWQLISVAHEEGNLHDLRAILANKVAAEAFRRKAVVFPEGAKIVRIAWQYVPSAENNRAFGRDQSFVAGEPTNIQLMIRDSKRYAETNGWGYAQFADPTATNEATHPESCSSCHLSAKQHGYVFTRYSR